MVTKLTSRPGVAALVLAALTAVLAVFALTALEIDGDVARAVKGDSAVYEAHQALEHEFGAPSQDEVFLVRAEDFGRDATFDALESLVIDLQLTEGVRGVMSIFALPDPAGEGLSFLTRNDIVALPAAERLAALADRSPIAADLMSEDRSATLIVVLPELDRPTPEVLAAINATLDWADPALDLKSVSLAALQREISAALLRDQLFIIPVALLFCVLLALALFRSWRAALLVALPSIAGLLWTFAGMAALGIPMDPFMAIMPTILIVLGIADSIHVFHAVQRLSGQMSLAAAVARGLHETLPAVVLAALTTALAFLCLLVVGSPTLANLAVIGPLGLVLTTLAVYALLPPAIMLLFARVSPTGHRSLEFRAITDAAIRALRARGAISLVAVVILGVLLAVQTQTTLGYRLMDHIPRGGEFRATLEELREVLPGSDQSFVLIPAADPGPDLSEADRARLDLAAAALYGAGGGFVPSRDTQGVEQALLTRFIGETGTAFALPLMGRLDLSWVETREMAAEAVEALAAVGIEDAVVTGYSQMSAVELPGVVSELRLAFYVAVALVTAMAVVFLRSVKIALLSLIPNLIPILGVEAWLVLTGEPLTITGAIAFTIAFGIALDDTLHLLNRVRLARAPGAPVTQAVVEEALRATAAPVITTSLVLLAGFSVTAFSLLPSVSVFGELTATAMVLALVADLFLFPSLLVRGSNAGDGA